MSSDPARQFAPHEESPGQRETAETASEGTYKFYCPGCGQRIEAPISVSCMAVACPECGCSFLAPIATSVNGSAHAGDKGQGQPKKRVRWVIALGVAALFAISPYLAQLLNRAWFNPPVSANPGVDSLAAAKAATIGYWKALEKIINVEPLTPDMATLLKQREFQALSEQWQRYGAQKRQGASEIRNLRTTDVDEAVVDYGLKMADSWSDAALFCDEGAQLAIGFGNFHSNYNSGTALAENFVRGALGDNPLNKMREGQAEMERLKERESAWNSHGRELDRQKNALLSERTRLRTLLNRKFGIEL